MALDRKLEGREWQGSGRLLEAEKLRCSGLARLDLVCPSLDCHWDIWFIDFQEKMLAVMEERSMQWGP